MPENHLCGKTDIEHRLHKLVARVRLAEKMYGREPGSVQILPVSKTRPAHKLAELAALALPEAGNAFGESYLQEAEDKITQLAKLNVQWHFIGPIQSNKTQAIAQLFQWVHSVERIKIARRLNHQRPAGLPPLNVCLQVNISGETSKSGVSLDALPALASQVATLPNLRLRGLMAIPAASRNMTAQRAAFAAVRQAFHSLNLSQAPGMGEPEWDTLSMGMSADLEAAIAEGATIVRIGTDIFGPRVAQVTVD
ncbi:MAG: YggS family pyridoxal phosphate-dependent enzyme [Gammaproteobacteria bacterium]|nr:YggS family pyridoxal phosphate-dependent enzyme [Gammaproteobacteria bacterium]